MWTHAHTHTHTHTCSLKPCGLGEKVARCADTVLAAGHTIWEEHNRHSGSKKLHYRFIQRHFTLTSVHLWETEKETECNLMKYVTKDALIWHTRLVFSLTITLFSRAGISQQPILFLICHCNTELKVILRKMIPIKRQTVSKVWKRWTLATTFLSVSGETSSWGQVIIRRNK